MRSNGPQYRPEGWVEPDLVGIERAVAAGDPDLSRDNIAAPGTAGRHDRQVPDQEGQLPGRPA